MKKTAAMLLCGLLLLLCACTRGGEQGSEIPTVPLSYTAELSVEYNGKTASAVYTQQTLSNIEIEFTSPLNIKGLTLKFNGSECSVGYSGLSFSTDLSSLPETNFGRALIDSFKAAAEDTTIKKTFASPYWHYEGETSGRKFTLIQNAQTGFFEQFEMPLYGLKIELKNPRVTEQNS